MWWMPKGVSKKNILTFHCALWELVISSFVHHFTNLNLLVTPELTDETVNTPLTAKLLHIVFICLLLLLSLYN